MDGKTTDGYLFNLRLRRESFIFTLRPKLLANAQINLKKIKIRNNTGMMTVIETRAWK